MTCGHNGHVIQHVNDSWKMKISVEQMKRVDPDDESEVLVVLIEAYDLGFRCLRFWAWNLEIAWLKRVLLSLKNPISSNSQDTLRNKQEESGVSIVLLPATAFVDLLAGEEGSAAFVLKINDSRELLGPTVAQTHEWGEFPCRHNVWARSSGDSCVSRVLT